MRPVVVGNANEVPLGGSTKPIETERVADESKFAMTKSPGSCPDVFDAKVGADGAVTDGSGATVELFVTLVALNDNTSLPTESCTAFASLLAVGSEYAIVTA
ncbi:MAG: hypothetical protein EBX09_05285 [Actinobacteria bacterium]|nr:hypothetical protein [Actinomycetota bacterium]